MWNTNFELVLCWCFVSECSVCFASFDVVCDEFEKYVLDVCWCSLCVSVCMLTVSNDFLMSSATEIVHSGGLFW